MAGYRSGLWHSRILLPGLHTFRTSAPVLSRIAACSFRRESGTCTPPFFRTSAGHRVEGRNPWHLQCSRNQLRAGTQFRRLVRSLSLRPSWLLASWADQTERKLSLPKASTSGLPAPKSPCGLPDITTAPNGELRRQDFHLQVQQLVSLRSLLWVLVGWHAPLRLTARIVMASRDGTVAERNLAVRQCGGWCRAAREGRRVSSRMALAASRGGLRTAHASSPPVPR